jgi:hypothetical protein
MYPGLLYSEVNTILTIDASRKSLPRISTDEAFANGRAEFGCARPKSGGRSESRA